MREMRTQIAQWLVTIDVRTLKEVGRRVFAGIFPSWVAVWRALRNDSLVCFHSEVPVSPVSCSSGDWKVKCGVNASQLSAVCLQLALVGQCRYEARTCWCVYGDELDTNM